MRQEKVGNPSDRNIQSNSERLKKPMAFVLAMLAPVALTACGSGREGASPSNQPTISTTETPAISPEPPVVKTPNTVEPVESPTSSPSATETEAVPANVLSFAQAKASFDSLTETEVNQLAHEGNFSEAAQYLAFATENARLNGSGYLTYYDGYLAKSANPNLSSLNKMSAENLYKAKRMYEVIAWSQTDSGESNIGAPSPLDKEKAVNVVELALLTGSRNAKSMPVDVSVKYMTEMMGQMIHYNILDASTTQPVDDFSSLAESAQIVGRTQVQVGEELYDATLLESKYSADEPDVIELILHVPVSQSILPNDSQEAKDNVEIFGQMQYDESGNPITHDGDPITYPLLMGQVDKNTALDMLGGK